MAEDSTQLLAPFRAQIDALDGQLADLLAARFEIVKAVAEIKAEYGIEAVLPDRVEQVIENAAARSAGRGLSPDMMRKIWRVIVDESCALEIRRKENA